MRNGNEVPPGLFKKIMSRIRKEERLSLIKQRAVIFSISTLASLVLFVPIVAILEAWISTSGVTAYLSLLVSDYTIIFANWQSFIFAILEGLPAMSLIALFSTLLIFGYSLKTLVKNYELL